MLRLVRLALPALSAILLASCASPDGTPSCADGEAGGDCPPRSFTLTVTVVADLGVQVTSSPEGITCPGTCSAAFVEGTEVVLTASTIGGWSAPCSSFGTTCAITLQGASTATFTTPVECGAAACPSGGFCVAQLARCVPIPSGHVPVSVTVDDAANQVFAEGELGWRGSWGYDEPTRTIWYDQLWSGPSVVLHDDGPWFEGDPPGHEGPGSVAGDHVWGATVFAPTPATGTASFEYGIDDLLYRALGVNSWLWTGANGEFSVSAGADLEVQAPGLSFPEFGPVDLRLTLDTALLDTSVPRDTSVVAVAGSEWRWTNAVLADDGTKGDELAADGVFTFVLSEWVGPGTTLVHTGLLRTGAVPQFVWRLAGQEYRVGELCATAGLSAEIRQGAGAFAELPIEVSGSGLHPCAVWLPF